MESAHEIPPLNCGNCRKPLPWAVCNTTDLTRCPSCNATLYATVFPAMFRSVGPGKSGETLLTDGEASCYYHSHKKAVVACSNCGRFLCALCDIDLNGQHLCSICLEAGSKQRNIKNLENRRVLYDDLALSLAIVPMVTVYFTLLTAPIVLFLSIKYWKAPASIIPRSKFRFVLAVFIALLQMAGWIALIGILFGSFRKARF
jgi:hypothetical protein